MTPTQFGWFTTVFVGVMSFGWFAVDVRNLIVTRNLDRRDPLVRDRRFAYVMGVIMTTIGIIGTLRFHAVL
jgi:hypothetical protein